MGRFAFVFFFVLAACQSKPTDKQAPEPTPQPTPTQAEKPTAPAALPMVDLAAFAKDCQEATDCVLVKRSGCDPCACAVDAIASKEGAKFDEAAATLECPPPDLDRQMACGGCDKQVAACTNGQCVMAAQVAPATP